jgi:hypothetical protein
MRLHTPQWGAITGERALPSGDSPLLSVHTNILNIMKEVFPDMGRHPIHGKTFHIWEVFQYME